MLQSKITTKSWVLLIRLVERLYAVDISTFFTKIKSLKWWLISHSHSPKCLNSEHVSQHIYQPLPVSMQYAVCTPGRCPHTMQRRISWAVMLLAPAWAACGAQLRRRLISDPESGSSLASCAVSLRRPQHATPSIVFSCVINPRFLLGNMEIRENIRRSSFIMPQ